MSNITVQLWSRPPEDADRVDYPPDSVTRISSPGTVLLPPTTRVIVITCDVDTRVTFDGSAVTAGDMLVSSAYPNEFAISARATGVTLTFL